MKLFLSYSRDDKAWVYELWRALRDRAHHDAWIDQRIVPAQDWWETILDNIEAAECFVYVLTPKSVESIYCQAEAAYALALNKPIIPLMLKSCDYPDMLRVKRIQYEAITDQMSLGDVLFSVEHALSEVRVELLRGAKYPTPSPSPSRPSEPHPAPKTEQAAEVFLLAADAAADGNDGLAEKLYGQVVEADPEGWGQAAQERLEELRQERDRRADYERVKSLRDSGHLKDARAAWRVYVKKHGPGDDPDGLAALAEPANPPPSAPGQGTATPPARRASPRSKPLIPIVTEHLSVVELLPLPFEWVEIPAGKVTLGPGGYLKERTTFEVLAFFIAKYPITNAQYAMFIEAGGYNSKTWWTNAGWLVRKEKGWIAPRLWQDSQWNNADCPVVGVSWYEAAAFCRWLSEATGENVTLPSEQQWQRAAQGDDGQKYPWGNEEPDERQGNYNGSVGHTTPVTQYLAGASPYGVMDMSGNVSEWCLTAFDTGQNDPAGANDRVLRGGSWYDHHWYARSAYRAGCYPDVGSYSLGFRVCASAPT